MAFKKIRPLGNKVLLKRLSAEVTKGGIILPDTAQEKPKQAEVVAVGPGKFDENGTLIKMTLKVGDKVLFSPYSGTEAKADENEYLIMSEDDVLAIIS
ncbi:MAG: co-chaperone GroES [Chlamydiae bacterium]|nr:co-chaperone GroES [Chlamydiota bacterium]